jgi:hypothetical protein
MVAPSERPCNPGARDTPPAAEWRGLCQAAPFSAVGLGAVSPIAPVTAAPLVWLAGALDVSVSFFVYSRDGCYELLAV